MNRIVTLITDFGWDDAYAGAVKGAILSVNPDVTIIDITHGVPPHSILDAALCLRAVFSHFPPRTVHLVVVDPGVGGQRRGLLVTSEHHFFVGPDNGVFTFAREELENSACYELTAAHYFHREISPTFHARDVFGPVAGWLTKGIAPENFGEPVNDPVRLRLPQPVLGRGRIDGHVIRIDRFGNLLTSIREIQVRQVFAEGTACCLVGEDASPVPMGRSYIDVDKGDVVALIGSSGFVEVAVNQGRAQAKYSARVGMRVALIAAG